MGMPHARRQSIGEGHAHLIYNTEQATATTGCRLQTSMRATGPTRGCCSGAMFRSTTDPRKLVRTVIRFGLQTTRFTRAGPSGPAAHLWRTRGIWSHK
eukprot:3955489-Prymnesium_polylepis.1